MGERQAPRQQETTLGDTFLPEVIQQAFNDVARGQCQCCGKDLVFENRNQRGERGAWHAHHVISVSQDPHNDTLENCAILCINGENCHLNCAHGGNYNQEPPAIQTWGGDHDKRRCWSLNQDGTQCSNMIPTGQDPPRCHRHS